MKTCCFSLTIALFSMPMSGQIVKGDVEIRRGTTVDVLGMASTDLLKTPTMFREVHIRVPLPQEAHLNGRLILTYDTASRRACWLLLNEGESQLRLNSAQWFASHATAFVAEDKMVVFWVDDPGRILIVERRDPAASTMDEAQQKAIDDIRRHATDTGTWMRFLRGEVMEVPLPEARIGFAFWNPPYHAQIIPGRNYVISASREGNRWRLVLQNQWDQEVILDDAYNFISTRRLGPVKEEGKE